VLVLWAAGHRQPGPGFVHTMSTAGKQNSGQVGDARVVAFRRSRPVAALADLTIAGKPEPRLHPAIGISIKENGLCSNAVRHHPGTLGAMSVGDHSVSSVVSGSRSISTATCRSRTTSDCSIKTLT
jgi:hypothetical protein